MSRDRTIARLRKDNLLSMTMTCLRKIVLLLLLAAFTRCHPCFSQAQTRTPAAIRNGYRLSFGADSVEVQLVASNIVRVDVKPGGHGDDRTSSLDPALSIKDVPGLRTNSEPLAIETGQVKVEIAPGVAPSITIKDASGNAVIEADPLSDAAAHTVRLQRTSEEPLYGMRGTTLEDSHPTLPRNSGKQSSPQVYRATAALHFSLRLTMGSSLIPMGANFQFPEKRWRSPGIHVTNLNISSSSDRHLA